MLYETLCQLPDVFVLWLAHFCTPHDQEPCMLPVILLHMCMMVCIYYVYVLCEYVCLPVCLCFGERTNTIKYM